MTSPSPYQIVNFFSIEATTTLTHREILKFIKIEQTIQKHDYEKALVDIQNEIDDCEDKEFKKALLNRLFFCANFLNQKDIAVEAADRMLQLEKDNIYVILYKVEALTKYEERISVLEEALKINDHYPDLINRLVSEKLKLISFGDILRDEKELSEIEGLIEKSISSNPRIVNPAWKLLYHFYDDEELDPIKKESGLKRIIEEHLKQDPYSYLTTQLIFSYCKKKKIRSYNGLDIIDILEKAFIKHFSKNYAAHFAIYSDACIEYQEYGYLRDLIERCDAIDNLTENEDYIATKINLQLDVYRDIHECILLAEAFLKTHRSLKVDKILLNLYVQARESSKATKLLNKLKGTISYNRYFQLLADIFEVDNRFQDAIDAIMRIPDKEFFIEKHTTSLSYFYLKMGNFEKGRECCHQMLKKHNFSNKFQAEIINYEFSKLKIKQKISKNRLTKILENPNDDSVEAVALLLLGDKKKALSIIKKEIEKRFSSYYMFLKWPVLENVKNDIEEYVKSLIENRRVLKNSDEHE